MENVSNSSSKSIGKVIQVVGSTLDAQFSEDAMPEIYNALTLEVERPVIRIVSLIPVPAGVIAVHVPSGTQVAATLQYVSDS